MREWNMSTLSLNPFFTSFTPIRSFIVRLPKGVAKTHNAARCRAMRQLQGVAELVDRFFHRAAAKGFFVSAHPQPE